MNSKIRKDGSFCLHATAAICAFVFIDGEAGELGDITHFLQAFARVEHHFWFAEHGRSEFFGCRRSGTAHSDAEVTQIAEQDQCNKLNTFSLLYPCLVWG